MRAVAGSRGRPIVVANAAEGEPTSMKDRTLLEMLPHLVIDGAIVAAEAVGADEVIICACESAGTSVDGMEHAIAERAEERAGGATPKLHLATVPSHYVAGQESALISYLGGGPAKPTFTPPMPFEQGLRRRPTLVNNVETLAHLALIARHGASWFRQLGTPTQPGSALVTLSGPVASPGVYEIEHGASLKSLIDASGGATTRVRGALLGGYAGAWIGADRLQGLALSKEHLAPHGATLGAGIVFLLSEHACPVAETARVGRWMAEQSTRQCGPCLHGLDALAGAVEERRAGCARDTAHRTTGLADEPSRGLRPPRRSRQPAPQRPRDLRGRVCRPCTPRPLRGLRAAGGAAAAATPGRRRPPLQAGDAMSHRVRVNPITCEAHGMCAELLPERITLDEWGYPLLDDTPLHGSQVEHAMRAARACPTFALLVERERAARNVRPRAARAS